MKKSDENLRVIENFILHVTHSSDDKDDTKVTLTVSELYQMAKDYIEEDHADGKENPEDHIVTYGVESSFVTDDRNKELEEYVVIVAEFEDETQTASAISGIENLEAVNDFLKFIKSPHSNKM